jgi:K+-transporting ATPase ATPase C chain
MKLGKELLTAVIAVLVLTVVLGVAYPLAMTGISQVAFPNKADGSQVKFDGKVVGSRLIAKAFVLDTARRTPTATPSRDRIRATSSRGRRRPTTAPPAPSSPTAGRTPPWAASSSATRSTPTWPSRLATTPA